MSCLLNISCLFACHNSSQLFVVVFISRRICFYSCVVIVNLILDLKCLPMWSITALNVYCIYHFYAAWNLSVLFTCTCASSTLQNLQIISSNYFSANVAVHFHKTGNVEFLPAGYIAVLGLFIILIYKVCALVNVYINKNNYDLCNFVS